jgi:AraC-like DNA-binding protein
MDQLSFDTTLLPPAERFDRWRAGISDFMVEELDARIPFDGRSVVTGLGALLISESTLPPLRFTRTAAMIKASRYDHWTLSLAIAGTMHGDADGSPFRIGPGEMLLLDHARPAEIITTRGQSMVIVLPRNLLGLGRPTDTHGALPDKAEARLLVAYLRGLSVALPKLKPASGLQASRALCELVVACLQPAAVALSRTRPRAQAVRERLIAYVDARLDQTFDVADLCAALAVSRSSLYRAVGGQGGIGGLIRASRLEAAHRALTDASDARNIQEIAQSVGFGDPSQFSRHFHAAFGYTAAELRRSRSVPSALPAQSNDAAISFRRAVDRLATGPNPG